MVVDNFRKSKYRKNSRCTCPSGIQTYIWKLFEIIWNLYLELLSKVDWLIQMTILTAYSVYKYGNSHNCKIFTTSNTEILLSLRMASKSTEEIAHSIGINVVKLTQNTTVLTHNITVTPTRMKAIAPLILKTVKSTGMATWKPICWAQNTTSPQLSPWSHHQSASKS